MNLEKQIIFYRDLQTIVSHKHISSIFKNEYFKNGIEDYTINTIMKNN